MLLLLVYAVVLLRLIMVPLLSYFLEFLIYQSLHFQFHQIREKYQQTLNKLVLPLCLMKMKKVGDALDLMVFLAATPSLVVIFWSLMLVPSSIFSF